MKKTCTLLFLSGFLLFQATAQESDIIVMSVTNMCVDAYDESTEQNEDNPWKKVYGSFVFDEGKGLATLHLDAKEYNYRFVGTGDDEGVYYYVGDNGEKVRFKFLFREKESHLYLYSSSMRLAFIVTK